MTTTPTLREAAQQALEAIEPVMAYGRFGTRDVEQAVLQKAHNALRAALAEQAAEQASPAYLAEPGAAQATRADLVANWPEHNRARMTVALHYAAPAAEQAEPVAAERARIADGLLLKFQSAVSNVTRIHREYMGIVMPEDVYSRFATLRDETIPALRSEILAILAAPPAPARQEWQPLTQIHVDYVLQYGGRCRDCADENGVCPGSGLPCWGAERAVWYVLRALNYGFKHGYITAAPAEGEKR